LHAGASASAKLNL
jgi:hypothetical protein